MSIFGAYCSHKPFYYFHELPSPIYGAESWILGSFLLWPGIISDSQSWALELRAINKELKIWLISIVSLPSASILSWLVGPSLLLLNTSCAVVLGQEVCELLQFDWLDRLTFDHSNWMGKRTSYLVGRLGEDSLLPEVRGQVTVCLSNGSAGCLCW